MNNVIKSGQVISGTEHTFVRNRLTVVYPTDNPGGITTLKDLAKPGLKIVFAQKSVPVGAYALDFLAKASKLPEYTETFSPTVDCKRGILRGERPGGVEQDHAGRGRRRDRLHDRCRDGERRECRDAGDPRRTEYDRHLSDRHDHRLAERRAGAEICRLCAGARGQQVLVKYGFIPTIGSAAGAAPTAAPLEIGGLVDTPASLTLEAFNKLDQVEVKAKDKDGVEQTYKGVPLAALLEQVGVQSGATKVVFTGGDGCTAELTLADLEADTGAIVTADANGAFRNIVPSQMPKVWVKGLVKIELA